ncbi:MAG: protein translocase SEC61 complex subunit gamma [Candidatus Micrarchaeota archaeon]
MDIKGFLESSRRIFIVSKKPTMDEYKQMSKVSGLGIILLAIIGYIIFLFMALTGLGK